MTQTITKTMKTPTSSSNFAAKFFAALVAILLISGAQALYAQKLGRGFKLLEDKEYNKAMAFFTEAKDQKSELFAVNYALSKIYADKESPYFAPDKAMLCIKNAQKHQKVEKPSEETIKKSYKFDFKDVEVQYNFALYTVLNNINKIDAITKLFRMGINSDYERGILEEKAYKCALNENTTVSYSRFLEFYKGSKYAPYAKENYIKQWFAKADGYILNPEKKDGMVSFKALYPASHITKHCQTPEDYIELKNKVISGKDSQLAPELYSIIDISDSLNMDKDDILECFIVNYCLPEEQKILYPKWNLSAKPKEETQAKVNPSVDLKILSPTEINIELGVKLFKKNKTVQKAKPKSTPSGKAFVMETYGDNPYAMKDFDRGRHAIAFYYKHYFDTDIDWDYFADTLEKVDFDDTTFKAAVARLQTDFPNSFYQDHSNSVGNNVFTRICGAELVNNFGISSPIFARFENRKIPDTDMTFKSAEHYSTFRHPRSKRLYYYFVATTADSLVYGAYMLAPEIDTAGTLVGHKLVNLPPSNNKITILKSNSPGLVFFERNWRDLYYLEEEKRGNSTTWVVKKKYKREDLQQQ